MRLRVTGNGDFLTTKIVNAETGEPIFNVTRLAWTLDRDEVRVELDLLCEVEIELETSEVRRYRMLTNGKLEPLDAAAEA